MFTKRIFHRGTAEHPESRGRFTWIGRLMHVRRATVDPLVTEGMADADFESSWRVRLKRRASLIGCFLVVWFAVIEGRLVHLQVIQHDDLMARAEANQQRTIKPDAPRGAIVDRHGTILAYTVDADAIAADPTLITDVAGTVAAVCGALRDCDQKERADLTARLSTRKRFAFIRRSRALSSEQVERVASLKLPGVVLTNDTRRYYPQYELAAQVLGYVKGDNDGGAGVEYTRNEDVRGTPGLEIVSVDPRERRLEARVERVALPGANIELTIDLGLQHIAERELKAGVDANHARGGTVVIMDPHTGEILAMANYPTYNPNTFAQFSADDRRNRATQDIYEPGSTFKIVTASAAIEEGVVSPNDLIDTNPGYFTIPGRKPIRDTHEYGVLSFTDVIVKSSNVGAIKVGLRVGPERLAQYVRRFGFGQTLSPDFAGQSAGIWNPSHLDQSSLASMSMGYQIGVTPLQMVTAASAVANGGLLYEPHLVRAVVRNGVREAVAPKVVRRAITAETAATLTSMMEGVVERGTATAAALDNYSVAGKTGTAHKLVGPRYSDTDYNASFVGFAPSRSPKYAVLVLIDTPRAGTYYGGTVAAPVFKRIAEAALARAAVTPTINPRPSIAINAQSGTLPSHADDLNPAPVRASVGGPNLMPDVRGLSARQALRLLSMAGLKVRVNGIGFVSRQLPAPGEPVDPGSVASVTLDRTLDERTVSTGSGL